MALESLFRRLGFRRDPTAQEPGVPASVQVYSNWGPGQGEYRKPPSRQELAQYPGLEQHREAIKYLSSIGVSLDEIRAIYPEYEEYTESEFDDYGHAFRYMSDSYERTRLDRVMFTSDTYYPFMLSVDRQDRYEPHRKNALGIVTMPRRRVRLNVYPDETVSLQLQLATTAHLTDMATFFVDRDGALDYSELAMTNSHSLNSERRYEERTIARPISTVGDDAEAQRIMYFSQQFLEQGWDLTEADIAIPSAELTRRILTAPVETGIDLKAMLNH